MYRTFRGLHRVDRRTPIRCSRRLVGTSVCLRCPSLCGGTPGLVEEVGGDRVESYRGDGPGRERRGRRVGSNRAGWSRVSTSDAGSRTSERARRAEPPVARFRATYDLRGSASAVTYVIRSMSSRWTPPVCPTTATGAPPRRGVDGQLKRRDPLREGLDSWGDRVGYHCQ